VCLAGSQSPFQSHVQPTGPAESGGFASGSWQKNLGANAAGWFRAIWNFNA
jgi:hypothetical protein